jgi:glyoxylase-like metal-dependent hydrolase (beta-lactamase superfamily II)
VPAVTAWQEVADRIWVRRYEPYDVNVTVVAGEVGALLVDTRTSLAEAAEVRSQLRELPIPALTAVAVTHDHLDHCLGAGAFPGLPLWGSEGCRDQLRSRGIEQRDRWLELLPEEAGVALRASPIVLPDHLVRDRACVELGGREVELLHLGAGHTDHDLVVHVADASTVLTGDLVEVGAPPAFEDAHPFAWPATLGRVEALGAATVVPGHGAPTDAAFLAGQQEELAHLAALLREALGGLRSHDTVLAGSPFPEATTRTALTRAAATQEHGR